jgi:NAD(P)-dependent dehydrogenase (short-subunit alcohol dehydrogenase family)
MKTFEGKVAIIAGATSGLGRSIAIEFAKKGANVSICGRREKEGLETVELIKKEGVNALFTPCDISKENQVQFFLEETIKVFGKIDFAINNAAVAGSLVPLTEYTEEAWDNVVNINLKGTFFSMKHEVIAMLKNPMGGTIVNVSSALGLVGGRFGVTPYSASKHGVIGLTKSAALEYSRKKIRINAICVGIMDTEMNDQVLRLAKDFAEAKTAQAKSFPLGRIASPEEVAKSAVWLCSEEASFITGVALPVDGGWTAQ